jgi:hypothetical protein
MSIIKKLDRLIDYKLFNVVESAIILDYDRCKFKLKSNKTLRKMFRFNKNELIYDIKESKFMSYKLSALLFIVDLDTLYFWQALGLIYIINEAFSSDRYICIKYNDQRCKQILKKSLI